MNAMDSRCIIVVLLILFTITLPCAGERAPDPGALQAAVESGNVSLVEQLLSRGADPEEIDALGRTPLYCAVSIGSLPLVERLLKTASDPDVAGPDGLTPLMKAVLASREDLVMALLSGGADPDIVSDAVSEQGAEHSVSALSLAVDRGEFELIKRLIQNGADGLLLADPEMGAPNPLDLPMTQVPLDARIWRDMAFLADSASSPDWKSGAWPLHQAAFSGEWSILRDMLDEGADPNTSDPLGVTPLMAASWHGRDAAVSLLLQRGADPRAVDSQGRGALCYAAGGGHERIAASIMAALDSSALKASVPKSADRAEPEEFDFAAMPEYYALIGSHPRILAILVVGNTPAEAADSGINNWVRADSSAAYLKTADSEGVTLLMIAAWMSDLRALKTLLPVIDGSWNNGPPGEAARDEAGRTALDWCLAAFERDRRVGREIGLPNGGFRNYPIARLLARRSKNPSDDGILITADVHEDVIESWSIGHNPRRAEDWRDIKPSPVPASAGDGDLILYRILRDEEPGFPTES